jgi:hypothetical protein
MSYSFLFIKNGKNTFGEIAYSLLLHSNPCIDNLFILISKCPCGLKKINFGGELPKY